MTESSVRVAVRIRPQMPSEVLEMCHVCTNVTPGEPQIVLGKDKAFTFDNVFDIPCTQDEVYSTCITDLINGCLKGYNATILAYGQTGSGKTYTMGTGFDVSRSEEEKGIIPRAVHQLFDGINTLRNEAINKNMTPPDFKVVAQFMELYNEEVIDLLDSSHDREMSVKNSVKIHEDSLGQIYTVGLTSCPVTSAAEALQCLQEGALSRTTASTNMNVQSSRSHAIFTLHLKMQRLIEFEPSDESEKPSEEFETLMAKLHFVDLAGSERLKRTGATGERAREGISINCGLLALGNVISALGDKTRKATHVPYRDSKLTRLLQDSLGGNSQTLMIACVSPSDRDFMETLNTLKYANRAKNIRNKISINQDKSSQTIALLRREIQKLQLELIEYKQGKRIIGENGEEQINDMYHENMFLETENNNLRSRLKALQETLDHQTQRVTDLLAEKAAGGWITGGDSSNSDITEVIKGYLKEIEELRVKLMESEETCSLLRKQNAKLLNQKRLNTSYNSSLLMEEHIFEITPNSPSTLDLINEAKEEIKQLSKQAKAIKRLEENGKESKENGEDEKEKEDSPEDTSTKMNGDAEMNGQLDDEEEEEEVEGSSEDSDSEEKNSNDIYDGDLAQLAHDISMKQKLIEALEQSQQRLKMMKKHYEEKLWELEQKIRETENERDKILANLSANNKDKKSDEKVKKVKEDFESKLKSLQAELRKMQVAKKEHAKVMRNQAQYERQIQTLKNEVAEMKKTKVRLINKMKEDNQRHLQSEQVRNREIAQLKKQSRMKENQIRSLQAENRLKENVLKRKQEELAALRKNAKTKMSDRVAGRVPRKDNLNSTYILGRNKGFSPKVVKSRWQNLEKSINQLVISKQTINCIERDMERYLKSRENLTRKLEALQAKRRAAILEKKSLDVIQDYEDNIETLKANIDYCQENIAECQSSIMQMEEAKEEIDIIDVEKMTLGLEETKYLLSKLINMAINQTFQAFQKDAALKEMEEKLKQSKNDNAVHMELLERLVEDGNTEILDFVISSNDPITESQASSRSNSPVDSSVSEMSNFYLAPDCSKSKKRPRKTGLPSDFISDISHNQSNMTPAGSCPSVAEPSEKPSMSRLAWSYGPALQQELDLDKTLTSSPNKVEDRGIVRVTSAPTSLQDMALSRKVEKSPLARRRTHEKQSHMAEFSPAFRRKFYSNASVIPLPSLSRQSSTETTVSDITPPNSPSASRKDNVFSRLTSGSFRLNKPGSGIIQPFTAKTNLPKNCPLSCTHVAEGHSRAILSLAATDDVLFSSSKDRTVKIWDLSTGKEIQSLGGHPSNVCAIRYNEYSRLAFSVSTAYIKVWDVRENPAKCIQTLNSSGATNSTPAVNTPSRTLQMPQGESQIHDIALSRYGTTLFSAASNLVRIWDLRMYKAIGKLSGSYQAAIMCLAVDNNAQDKNTVVTGSKDHYIKVFEVAEGEGGLHSAKIKLKPPHYDGVQSLAMNENTLFSGSRDKSIKKWNLKTGSHIQSLNQAHRDWVCALSFFSNNSVLLSGCRGGFLKIWSVESSQQLGEIKAHSASINAIVTNRSCIFTASSDCTVGIWNLKNSNDLSPENNEYDS